MKGFNELIPAYPGMTLDEILHTAKDIGLNNVRFWIPGASADPSEGGMGFDRNDPS